MHRACLGLIAIGWIAIAAAVGPREAIAEQRPTAISMGMSGTVEDAPFAQTILGLPVTIDVGTLVSGELWWHASASFGVGEAIDEGDGHVFELHTGPRVQHCWNARRLCLGASLELGWGHSRWNLASRDDALSYDDLQLEARARASIALTPSGQVLLEASAGPRARYYLRGGSSASPMSFDRIDAPLARGVAAGLALVVRN